MVEVKSTNGQVPRFDDMFIMVILFFVSIFYYIFTYHGMFGWEIDYSKILLYVKHNFIGVVLMAFFLFVSCFCFYGYIVEVLIKPKKEILYLKKIDKSDKETLLHFLDKRGKPFSCLVLTTQNFLSDKYYEVIKTKYYVKYIGNIVNDSFEVMEKRKNFWLCIYTPIWKYENIFLLPILYMIAFICIALIFIERIINLPILIISIYFIIYDIVYKLKNWK